MATIKTVVVAGASGNLGSAVLKALLDANYTVTVITRPDSSHSFPSNVKVAKVEYSDADGLKNAMEGQDALVSCLGYAAMKTEQEQLIDAAVASGVKRILPSEFGANPDCAAVRQLPVFGYKVAIEQYVKQKIQGTSTTYTLVCNNEFFDWDIDFKFAVDIKEKKMEIFDDGNYVYSAAPLAFVAKGVVSVLQHPAETANRAVRLHGMSMTQNKFLDIIQRFTGKEGWQTPHVSTEEREKQGYELLQKDPSNMFAWAIPMLQVSIWADKFGSDFSKNNDNELLGLKPLTDAEIEEIVRARC